MGGKCAARQRDAQHHTHTDGDGSRPFMIVTFLALLEMIRLKMVRIFQSGGFGPIRVYKRARPADAPYASREPGR